VSSSIWRLVPVCRLVPIEDFFSHPFSGWFIFVGWNLQRIGFLIDNYLYMNSYSFINIFKVFTIWVSTSIFVNVLNIVCDYDKYISSITECKYKS